MAFRRVERAPPAVTSRNASLPIAAVARAGKQKGLASLQTLSRAPDGTASSTRLFRHASGAVACETPLCACASAFAMSAAASPYVLPGANPSSRQVSPGRQFTQPVRSRALALIAASSRRSSACRKRSRSAGDACVHVTAGILNMSCSWARHRATSIRTRALRCLPACARESPRWLRAGHYNTRLIERANVRSLVPLGARRDVERNLLIFAKALVAVTLNGREVGEHVLAAAVRRNESEPFTVVEPFDDACSHLQLHLMSIMGLQPEARELQGREMVT